MDFPATQTILRTSTRVKNRGLAAVVTARPTVRGVWRSFLIRPASSGSPVKVDAHVVGLKYKEFEPLELGMHQNHYLIKGAGVFRDAGTEFAADRGRQKFDGRLCAKDQALDLSVTPDVTFQSDIDGAAFSGKAALNRMATPHHFGTDASLVGHFIGPGSVTVGFFGPQANELGGVIVKDDKSPSAVCSPASSSRVEIDPRAPPVRVARSFVQSKNKQVFCHEQCVWYSFAGVRRLRLIRGALLNGEHGQLRSGASISEVEYENLKTVNLKKGAAFSIRRSGSGSPKSGSSRNPRRPVRSRSRIHNTPFSMGPMGERCPGGVGTRLLIGPSIT